MLDIDPFTLGWLIAGCLFILLEFIVPGAILSFLGLAALVVAGLLNFKIINSIVMALIVWFLVSLLFILILRSFVLRFMPSDSSVQNTDEDLDAIGSEVEVIESITPPQLGRIRFRDTTWGAKSDQSIKANSKAIITGRDGNNWIVK